MIVVRASIHYLALCNFEAPTSLLDPPSQMTRRYFYPINNYRGTLERERVHGCTLREALYDLEPLIESKAEVQVQPGP